MQDRRKTLRRRTFLGGSAVFNHRQSAIDCVLRNMGERGARLVFEHTAFVPDEFDLDVERMQRSFRASVAWRGRNEIGVTFGPARVPDIARPDQTARIRKLEAENVRLETRVAELSTGGA